MNNQLVKRMNTVGKVGKIITIVVIVLSIIATLLVTGCAIVASAIPQDTVTADVSAQADVVLKNEVFKDVRDDIIKGVNDHSGETGHIGSADVSFSADEKDGDAVIHVNAENIDLKSGIITPALWMAVIGCIGFVVCAFFFMFLMGDLAKAPSPFTDGVVKRMKIFAIVLLAVSIVTSLCSAIVGSFIIGHGFSFTLNIGSIFTAAIIFVLATVFNYGAQLQKESDETL